MTVARFTNAVPTGSTSESVPFLIASWKRQRLAPNAAALKDWWTQIDGWRARKGWAA